MRLILTIFSVAVLALTACQNAAEKKVETQKATAPAVSAEPSKAIEKMAPEDAPRITLAEAKKEFDAGAVFIDTRGEATFKQERVKGSINISMESVDARYKEIPAGKKIIAYCS